MNAPTAIPNPTPVPPYKHTPLFPLGADTTPYKKITAEGVAWNRKLLLALPPPLAMNMSL